MSHRQVTLIDVAERAGVSPSTASNALTGSRTVSAKSIERVLSAAAELGYRRNEIARSLRTGLKNMIGLVIPDVTNPFFAEIVRTVEELANAQGWSILLCNSGFEAGREVSSLARLVSAADGVLLFSTSPDEHTVRSLLRMGIPVVAADEKISAEGTGGVYSDNEGGARRAAHHLKESGGTRFGLIEGPHTHPTARERSRGFLAGLAAHGIVEADVCRVSMPYSLEGGRAAMRDMLARCPEVDAIFASTDMQAIGAIFEGADLGHDIPDDIMICGFDGISWADRIHPSLTTLSQDAHQMAKRAFEMLIAMIVDDAEPETIVLPVELVTRRSTTRQLPAS